MFAHASTASAVAFRPIATARLAGTGRSQTTKTRSRVVSNVASSGAPSGASSPTAAEMYPALYDPKQRDAKYGGNIARYLVDCHDTPGVTFNFCGGMMFGLVLSPALRAHLGEVASAGAGDPRQPKLYDASVARMSMKPDGYDKDASADDATVFHGREVRKVSAPPHGSTSSMFIHLSLANGDDVEGWSAEEVDEYSGWMSDRGRRWRDGGVYAAEGKGDWYRSKFGPEAFGLHHRFYLHKDGGDGFWLSAEDGCEGVAQSKQKPAFDFGGPAARSPFNIFG